MHPGSGNVAPVPAAPAHATPAGALIEAMSEASALLDLDGTVVLDNQAWRRRAQRAAVPGDGAARTNYLQRCLAGAETQLGALAAAAAHGIARTLRGECPHFRLAYHDACDDGWFDLHVTRWFGEGGGVLVRHVDSSACHAAEQHSSRLAQMLAHSLHEIYTFDGATLRFAYANQRALDKLGYSLERIEQLTMPDIAPELDSARLRTLLAPLRSGQAPLVQLDTSHRRSDGSSYPVELHVQLAPDRERFQFMAQAVDTTARRHAQQCLREAAEYTDAVLENMVDGVITMDGQDRIVSINRAAGAMFGYQSAHIVGQSMDMLLSKPHRGIHRQHRDRGLRDVEGVRADGSVFQISLSVSRLPRGSESVYVGLVCDISDRKRADAAVTENARLLQTLARRVLAAQETERRRVANELHDELGQALTAIKINLLSQQRAPAEPPEAVTAANLRIIDQTLVQVRRLALALRPPMLDDLGLVPALRWIADQTAARAGLRVSIEADLGGARLATEIETACFRIVQEALTNVVRHARAHAVSIVLRYGEDRALVLSITDDGCGFDPVAVRRRALAGASIGTLGMQERATLIGAALAVEAQPGQGCCVRLTIAAASRR